MSRTSLGFAVAAALTFGGLAVASGPAAAAPMVDPGVAGAAQSDRVKPEQARIVCNRWGRCWRVWGGPRFYGPGPGWRRHWGWRHRGWHHGWRRHW